MIFSLSSRRRTPGIDHLRRERVEQLVAGNQCAERSAGELGDRVVDDSELRTKLAAGARRVDLPEAVFPEPATHRKQRVVLDDDLGIAANLADARSLKLA